MFRERLGTMILSAFLFAAVLMPLHAQDPLGRPLKVGVYENAPKIFTDADGQPAGLFVDILEQIAKENGWELEFVHGYWAESLERLERGEIDIMPDVAFTSARSELFDFHSEPVLSSWFQVYAPKGSGIRTILDLAGKKVVVLENSVQYDTLEQLTRSYDLEVSLRTEPDYDLIFEKTAAGHYDAAVTNNFYGLMHADDFGLEDTAVIFSPTALYYAITRGDDPYVAQTIDASLIRMKRDPESVYYRSMAHWLKDPVEYRLPLWARLLIFGIVGSLLVVSLILFMFRSQLNKRTSELRRTNAQMEQRIIERTSELHQAMREAQEADRIKSAFLAAMSHELRTPLNSIIGFTGILLQELPGPLNEEQKTQLSMVQNSSRHLLSLINDVLDISKIEAGQLNLEMTDFDIVICIYRALSYMEPLAQKKDLYIETTIDQESIMVHLDQRRIEQIVINLLANAVKFTSEGGVRIHCRLADQMVHIEVSDSGIGMTEEQMKDLFTPFYQASNGLARTHEGTGLGLSISQRLANRMGGEITVTSSPGKGSIFTLHLPLTASDDEQGGGSDG